MLASTELTMPNAMLNRQAVDWEMVQGWWPCHLAQVPFGSRSDPADEDQEAVTNDTSRMYFSVDRFFHHGTSALKLAVLICMHHVACGTLRWSVRCFCQALIYPTVWQFVTG